MTDFTSDSGPRWLPKVLRRHFGNFSFLLIVLLILLLAHPFIAGEKQGEFFTAGFTLAFLAGLYAVRGERRTLKLGLILVIPAVVGSWASYFTGSAAVLTIGHMFEAAFLIFVTVVILRYIMTEKEVTADTIYGAACAYIMIGLIFAIGYSWLEGLAPGSFRGTTATGGERTWEFIYFSMVTMTTLGYGDIVPVHEGARSMASLQAILGQFYVAVLVARAVTLMVPRSTRP
jgi:hypothetical protein